MKFIKDFLFNREINSIKKKIAKLQEQALHLQRNGDLREYAFVVNELEELSDHLVQKLDENNKLSYIEPDSDSIDYDGMGNQGRFPKKKK